MLKILVVVPALVLAVVPVFSQNQVTAALEMPAIRRVAPSPQLEASTGFGDTALAHIADGGGWQTTITVQNLRATPTTFSIACYGDTGAPQPFSWNGVGVASALNGTLNGSGSLEIFTSGTAAGTSVGWCNVSSPGTGPNPSTQPKNDVAAFAIFSYAPTGQQVSVPASHWFLQNTANSLILAYDNTNGYAYGVALADSNVYTYFGQPNDIVDVYAMDQNGNLIGTNSFFMVPGSHLSFVLTDRYPLLANTRGTITFAIHTSSGIATLAGLGIRAAASGAFTSVSMIEPATY